MCSEAKEGVVTHICAPYVSCETEPFDTSNCFLTSAVTPSTIRVSTVSVMYLLLGKEYLGSSVFQESGESLILHNRERLAINCDHLSNLPMVMMRSSIVNIPYLRLLPAVWLLLKSFSDPPVLLTISASVLHTRDTQHDVVF